MRIFIQSLSGELLNLEVRPTYSIEDVREQFQEVYSPVHNLVFEYCGIQLDDTHTLLYYNINTDCILKLTYCLRFGFRIYFKTSFTDVVPLNVYPLHTVKEIKNMIQEKKKIPAGLQLLSNRGCLLEDEKTLSDCKITNDSELHLDLSLGGGLQVFVKRGWDHLISLDVKSSEKLVSMLTKMSEHLCNVLTLEQVCLVVEQLGDSNTASEYNIQNENVRHIVFPLSIVSQDTRYQSSHSGNERMTICVKLREGKLIHCDVYPNDTVYNVKCMIQDKEGTPIDSQILMFGGRQLRGYITLHHYKIENGSTLFMLDRCRRMQVYVNILNERSISIDVDPDRSIKLVKEFLQAKENLLPNLHGLYFRGKYLEEERTLAQYHIENEDTLYLSDSCIFINLPNEDNFTISINPKESQLECLKYKIMEKTGLSQQLQQLSINDTILSNGQLLSNYNIQNGSSLSLLLQEKPLFKLFVSNTLRKQIYFDVDGFHTIKDVKTMIQHKEKIPLGIQRLIYNREILENKRTLSEYKIDKDDTVFLDVYLGGGLKIFVKSGEEMSPTLKVHSSDTIEDLKALVFKAVGIKPSQQRLYFSMVRLENRFQSGLHSVVHLSIT